MVLRRDSVIDQMGVPIQEINSRSNLGVLVGRILTLPGLRGFWPMSSWDGSFNAYDISGQGRTLTPTNLTGSSFGHWSGLPYVIMNGVNQKLTRADEAGLDITGPLTMGCAVLNVTPTASGTFFNKYDGTGNQRSYWLGCSGNSFQMVVSGDGTGATQAVATLSGVWSNLQKFSFVVGKYIPSVSIGVYANGLWNKNTTSIPASIYNSSTPLQIGVHDGSVYYNCAIGMVWLCSYALEDFIIDELYDISRAFVGSVDL